MVRVKAATLVETLVAMVILLSVFAIASIMLVEVPTNSDADKLVRAENAINKAVEMYSSQHEITTDEMTIGNLRVRNELLQTVSTRCVKVKFRVYERDHLVKSENRVLFLSDESQN